jgi:hypothetical protein
VAILVVEVCQWLEQAEEGGQTNRTGPRGGKVVVTGLLGGNFSIAAAMFGINGYCMCVG